MKKLGVLALALAAGMTTFAAHSKEGTADMGAKTTEAAVEKKAGKPAQKETRNADAVDETATSSVARDEDRELVRISITPDGAKIEAIEEVTSDGKYGTLIAKYAAEYGVPVQLAHAVISVESNYKPNARGSAGEVGLMQIKPATARYMGFDGSVKELFHPETNIRWGMKYLGKAHKLGGGTTCGTILKYNAGHGAKKMNPVSARYCEKVKNLLDS